jgi:Ca-activated chloride channel homolog
VAYREMELPVNPELLKTIAQTTGGESYRATDRQELEDGLQKVLNSLERSKLMEGGASARYAEHYHPFLAWAVALIAAEFILRRTVLRVFP